jgi:hypothetical protein
MEDEMSQRPYYQGYTQPPKKGLPVWVWAVIIFSVIAIPGIGVIVFIGLSSNSQPTQVAQITIPVSNAAPTTQVPTIAFTTVAVQTTTSISSVPTATTNPNATPTYDLGNSANCAADSLVGQSVNLRNVKTTVIGAQCFSEIKDPLGPVSATPKSPQDVFLLVLFKYENNSTSAIKQPNIIIQDQNRKNYILTDADLWKNAAAFYRFKNDFDIAPGKTGFGTWVFTVSKDASQLFIYTQ